VFLAHYMYDLLIVFNVLSSLFSPSRVITVLELHWMGNGQLEKKKREKYVFGSFTWNSHAEQPECMFQRRRIKRKFPIISGFALDFLFLSFSRLWFQYI